VNVPLIVQMRQAIGPGDSADGLADLLQALRPGKDSVQTEAAPIGPNLSALRDATAGRHASRRFGRHFLVDSFRRGIAGTMREWKLSMASSAVWQALQTGDEDSPTV